MASRKFYAQIELQVVGTLNTVPTGFVGFNAKSDGLYQRISGGSELRLLTSADIGTNVAAANHTHPSYLTAEADTLQTVTGRGSTTTYGIEVSGLITGAFQLYTNPNEDYILVSDADGNGTWKDGNAQFDGRYLQHTQFPSQGLMKRGATSGTYSIVTDNSANWNTAYTHSQAAHQTIINGTGFVKASGTTLSYDNNSYSLSSHNHAGVYEPVLGNPAANGYVLSSTTAGVRSWIAMGGGGSVTSVGLYLPAEFNVSGSPVTTSGTLSGTWNTVSQNKVFASPATATGVPTFRSLVAADIPALPYDNYDYWNLDVDSSNSPVGIKNPNYTGSSPWYKGLDFIAGDGIALSTASGSNGYLQLHISYTGGGGGGYTHPTYTAFNPTLTGALVLASLTTNTIGSVTACTTRTLTLANLGYTGASNADYYLKWSVYMNGANQFDVTAQSYFNLVAGTNITLTSVPASKRIDISAPNAVGNGSDTWTSVPKVTEIVTLTQAEYTAATKVSTTLYVIVG